MKIKVCGMRDECNIKSVAALEPDYMGFIFYEPSARNACGLDPCVLNVISPRTGRVGVFVNASTEYILRQAERYSLDLLQLHGDESPEQCAELRKRYKVIKVFALGDSNDLAAVEKYADVCDYFLFDTPTGLRGGSGRKFDHSLLLSYAGEVPYFISGGIGPEDADTMAVRSGSGIYAVDINSCFETAPGIKSVPEVKDFIDKLRLKR